MTDTTEHQHNPNSILYAELGWLPFWAVGVLSVAVAIAVGIMLKAGTGNIAPFAAVGFGTAAWVFVPHPRRSTWMVLTKSIADLIWNAWAWVGVLVLFLFLMEARVQLNAVTAGPDLIEDINGLLVLLEPLPLALLFPLIYGAACLRVFLALADVLKKKKAPALSDK